VNNGDGRISNIQPLDYETKNQYIFQVVATDSGFPPRSAVVQVTVNVIDVDDNIPRFDQSYQGFIMENLPAGTSVTATGTNVNLRVVVS